jgi:histone H3/H4
MDPAVTMAAAQAFRAAGASTVDGGVLDETARATHIFILRLLKQAVTLSSGAHRSEANARDLAMALERLGYPICLLQEAAGRQSGEPIEVPVLPPTSPVPEFQSKFAKSVPPLPHAVGPRYPKLPAAHLCMATPQVPEPRNDYVTVRQELGRERTDMLSAFINLRLGEVGGIEVEGFPHLKVLAHSPKIAPPYLSFHNQDK